MQPAIEANPAALAPPADAPVIRPQHDESSLTRLIEQQTAKVPSSMFLTAAVAAMGASVVLELAGNRRASYFVGMWPGPLLIMGVYNKLVKVLGGR
jgi:hypothetical protein